MTLCYNKDTYEQVELPESQLAMWRETNNPKLEYYPPVPPKPTENAVWGAGVWAIPEPVVPASITARQIRLWLVGNGHPLAQVDAAINSIGDAQQREIARIEWEYAPYVERSHPMVAAIAVGLGMSAADIDRAFTEASSL